MEVGMSKYKIGDRVLIMGFDAFDDGSHFSGSICFVKDIRDDGTYDVKISSEEILPMVPEDQIYNLEDAIPAIVKLYMEATPFDLDDE